MEEKYLKVSSDKAKVQMYLAEKIWENRKFSRKYRFEMFLQKIVIIWIVLIALYAIMNLFIRKNDVAFGGFVVAFLLSILLAIMPKLSKKIYYQKNAKILSEQVLKTGEKVIEYELTEEYIGKSGSVENPIQWNEIQGYFCEDEWVCLLLNSERNVKFIMLNKETLDEKQKETLNYFIESKLGTKQSNWDIIWHKLYDCEK